MLLSAKFEFTSWSQKKHRKRHFGYDHLYYDPLYVVQSRISLQPMPMFSWTPEILLGSPTKVG